MILRRLYILCLIPILLPNLAWSQDPFYINYDTNDGLPSSETYFVYADDEGLIWIATDRGICAYNGYEFQTYTTRDGLSYNTNFRVFKDRKNRLWFTAWDGSLSIYENGRFTAVPLNKDTSYNKDRGYASQLLFDEDNNVFIGKNISAVVNQPGDLFRLDAEDLSVSRYSIFDFEDRIWEDEEREEVLVKIGDQYLLLDQKDQFSLNVSMKDTVSLDYFASFDNHRFKSFKNGQSTFLGGISKTQVNNFFLDPHNNLWLCTPKGILLYENADLQSTPRHFFKELEVTSITMDREGSYWFSSRERGVFWVPSFQSSSLLRSDQPLEIIRILSVGKLPGFLLCGTVNDGIFAVDEQLNVNPLKNGWETVHETERIYTSDDGAYYGRGNNILKETAGRLKTLATNFKRISYNNWPIRKLDNGLIFHAEGKTYTIRKADDLTEVVFSSYERERNPDHRKTNKRFDSRIYCIEEGDRSIWLGTLDGLYELPKKNLISELPDRDTSQIMNTRVSDILYVDSQQLWIASIGNGLIFKDGKHYQQWLEEDGLSSHLINRILLENDSTLWVASNKGLDRVLFRYQKQGVKIKSISNFSTSDGLVNNFINDLTIWKDYLWLATNKGVNYFRTNEMVENEVPPLIYIKEVMAGDRYLDDQGITELAHHENDLFFNFLGISFQKPTNKAFYRYRLILNRKKATWYYTDNRSIRFLDLAPGDYIFEVVARNKNGYWSERAARYSFCIKAHFTDQLWFRIAAALLLVSLLAIGFYYRVQTIKNQEEQKRKLQNSELHVLRNQMNPHFIFNSLNSIQSFIFSQDVKRANYYLAKFSRLMRDTLQYSKLDYISIYKETKFIDSYLELERLRFDDRFQVEMEVAPEIPVHNYFIPPLLLQPVLENAIKHAFKNISYQGKLEIQFLSAEEEGLLQIIIRDNGVGLSEMKDKAKDQLHQSLGLSIIKDRIKLLNLDHQFPKASFDFSNRYDATGTVIGTQAHFIIPIQLKEND